MVENRHLSAALAEAAQELSAPRDYPKTLQTIVEVARDSLAGVDHVGITVAHADGTVETHAATDDLVLRIDQLQYSLGEGPCLHALEETHTVRVNYAPDDRRWPRFVAQAAVLGLRSQLGVQLHLDERTKAVFNLYSTSVDIIDDEAEQLAELFATHASVALAHARQVDHLQMALESRTTISIAIGMLMERLGIDQETAFAYLTRVSASTETKLRDVAAAIVEQHPSRR